MAWSVADMPDLDGTLAIVTGANSGIGFCAALALAQHRARVVLACRSVERAQDAAARIRHSAPDARLEIEALDLASLASVRAFAARVADRCPRIDLLCNNAGLMALPRRLTEDGFEMQLGVNHFGHFALTGLLLARVRATPGARVVTVSSLMHRRGRVRVDDLDAARSYDRWGAYAQSKLANLLFAYELDRRLRAAGAGAISVACHPGYAATNLQRVGAEESGAVLEGLVMKLSNAFIAQSAARGALPTLYAATARDVEGGDFIGPGSFRGLWGAPVQQRSNRASHDTAQAARLWQISIERTGVDFGGL